MEKLILGDFAYTFLQGMDHTYKSFGSIVGVYAHRLRDHVELHEKPIG